MVGRASAVEQCLQLRLAGRGSGAEPHALGDGFVCAIEHQHVQVDVEHGGAAMSLHAGHDMCARPARATQARVLQKLCLDAANDDLLAAHERFGSCGEELAQWSEEAERAFADEGPGMTWSTGWVAVLAMRRVQQEGQVPRSLREKARGRPGQ